MLSPLGLFDNFGVVGEATLAADWVKARIPSGDAAVAADRGWIQGGMNKMVASAVRLVRASKGQC